MEHDWVEKFIAHHKVKAFLVGSSNFSDDTYFGGTKKHDADKGECDVMFIADDCFVRECEAKSFVSAVRRELGDRDIEGKDKIILSKQIDGIDSLDEYCKQIMNRMQ